MSIRWIYIYNHENSTPSSYHYNGFVAAHALGHIIWGYTLLVPINQMFNKLCKQGV